MYLGYMLPRDYRVAQVRVPCVPGGGNESDGTCSKLRSFLDFIDYASWLWLPSEFPSLIQFRIPTALQEQSRKTFTTHRLWRSHHSHRSGTRIGHRNSCHNRSCRPWTRTACPPGTLGTCYTGNRLHASAYPCTTDPATDGLSKSGVICFWQRRKKQVMTADLGAPKRYVLP